MKSGYDIVFLGTPPFAVPSLNALHDSRHRLTAVITQPDRPKGRGRRVRPSAVKETALQHGYSIMQPLSVKSDETVAALQRIAPDFLVVVAFGQLLSQALIDTARQGAVNVHASLLPKYRGPAPIQWAIINRETETGVTTMQMDAGMDTGDILLTAATAIRPKETAESLHDRLADSGAGLLLDTLDRFSAETLDPMPQDDSRASYAPMLTKEDGRIRWDRPAETIEALIRGVTPWPGAFAFVDGTRIRFWDADVIPSDAKEAPGTVVPGFPDELRIATAEGILSVRCLQGPSGKRLAVEDFLRGMPIEPGTVFY